MLYVTYPRRANNHAVPPRQSHVIVVFQPPADGAVTTALLAILQLLEKAKVTWNYTTNTKTHSLEHYNSGR